MSNVAPESEIQVNGVHLAYIEQGQGEPVVFAHGGTGDYRTWAKQMDDRTGYHRGAGPELPMEARLVAAADTYTRCANPRPHLGRFHPEEAASAVAEQADAGRLHPDAVASVVEAAGVPVPPLERPDGLTEREMEVVGVLDAFDECLATDEIPL